MQINSFCSPTPFAILVDLCWQNTGPNAKKTCHVSQSVKTYGADRPLYGWPLQQGLEPGVPDCSWTAFGADCKLFPDVFPGMYEGVVRSWVMQAVRGSGMTSSAYQEVEEGQLEVQNLQFS